MLSFSPRILITTLFWLWVFLALTFCGAFFGFMINLIVNQKKFYPLAVYGFTAIGFLIGLYKAERLRRRRALPEHMGKPLETPEVLEKI